MIIYFDAKSGVAGDMLVASLIDAGVDFGYLLSGIESLGLKVKVSLEEKSVNGIKAKRFIVKASEEHHHRSFKDIVRLIERSSLDDGVKGLSLKIFEKIAQAEAKIHGVDVEDVEFHEIGADDSIADIVGFSLCINYLKPDVILFSPLFDGRGFTKSMHGLIPVPAPAVLEIARLNNIPLGTIDVESELVTPTGIGIAATVSKGFTSMPYMRIKSIGYGAGTKVLSIPNLLRAVLGEEIVPEKDWFEVFANIDDMTGEEMALALEKVMDAGAVDVYFTPIYMKKGRPAYKLGAIVSGDVLDNVIEAIFRWTSTIGVRIIPLNKIEMNRESKVVNVEPELRLKVSSFKDIRKVKLEFEDLKKLM
ncbi:MAG: nickel pincer cofactor biosynthesis protein LarC [Synergistetes bacterium]|nr:nickel pincer cofactor biosynthesis protein LarC [Synergistota bacterium]MCX8127137.1 nickel pincer cofactor biosynthesis protein LarC [Synergistota bacterium]MDW8191977.1 nickel pincer cofactor biosynthesis protein LarC [Synergistota bacterium]